MIAREKAAIGIEQDHMARGMAGRRNGEKAGGQFDAFQAVHHLLGVRLGIKFQAVNDATSTEMASIFIGVGHVVLMREKNVFHAAQRLEPADKLWQKFGGINEPVAVGVSQKIAAA